MTAAYRPGVCNIGEAEIARRWRTASFLTFLVVVVASVLIASGAPAPARIVIWPFAAASAITWLQVIRRFCVAFGAIGIRNFGRRGEVESVDDPTARSADRRTALRMVVEGSIYAAVVTVLLVALPI